MACAVASPVPQLDGSQYRSVNCGPTVAAMALRHATCDRLTPTPGEVRARGNMGTGPTGLGDLKRGVAAFAPDAAALGYDAPRLIKLGYINADQVRAQLVKKTAFMIIAVSYKILQRDEWQAYRSDDYTGGHFICARKLFKRRSDGTFRRVRPYQLRRMRPATLANLWTLVLDPLADNRRRWIPQAPQYWPMRLFLEAGDAFNDMSRDGKLLAAVIFQAARLPT